MGVRAVKYFSVWRGKLRSYYDYYFSLVFVTPKGGRCKSPAPKYAPR